MLRIAKIASRKIENIDKLMAPVVGEHVCHVGMLQFCTATKMI